MIAVNNLLYCDALLAGTDCNRHTMLIRSSDEHNIFLLQSKIAHIDIGWYINTCQMTDMHTTVCVWQSGSYGSTFILFLFH